MKNDQKKAFCSRKRQKLRLRTWHDTTVTRPCASVAPWMMSLIMCGRDSVTPSAGTHYNSERCPLDTSRAYNDAIASDRPAYCVPISLPTYAQNIQRLSPDPVASAGRPPSRKLWRLLFPGTHLFPLEIRRKHSDVAKQFYLRTSSAQAVSFCPALSTTALVRVVSNSGHSKLRAYMLARQPCRSELHFRADAAGGAAR